MMITTTPTNIDPLSVTLLGLLVDAGFATVDTNLPGGFSFFKRTVSVSFPAF